MMGAMDNLAKGAAGQAVQNMNLMFGFDEDRGAPAGADGIRKIREDYSMMNSNRRRRYSSKRIYGGERRGRN